jgi:hypothetical protein
VGAIVVRARTVEPQVAGILNREIDVLLCHRKNSAGSRYFAACHWRFQIPEQRRIEAGLPFRLRQNIPRLPRPAFRSDIRYWLVHYSFLSSQLSEMCEIPVGLKSRIRGLWRRASQFLAAAFLLACLQPFGRQRTVRFRLRNFRLRCHR